MTVVARLRIPQHLVTQILCDLEKPHPFAYERVGFCTGGVLTDVGASPLVIINEYHRVADSDYVNDESVGARIGESAIRDALQRGLSTGAGSFHVHYHPGSGRPRLSSTDARELPRLALSFANMNPAVPHGILLINDGGVAGWTVDRESGSLVPIGRVVAVGSTLNVNDQRISSGLAPSKARAIESRQSFLGPQSQSQLREACVAIIGLGGGGSHIAQQLAHLGVGRFLLFDADHLEESNLNRTVTAKFVTARDGKAKFDAAREHILAVNPAADVGGGAGRWQSDLKTFALADVVVGCVDGFGERRDLEAATRRNLQIFIDIGMDVHENADLPPRLVGQLIASHPGAPCMRCLGFLSDEMLEREAEAYGAAGNRPQVIWSNGVLASTAVGIVADAITQWRGRPPGVAYLSYDGNLDTISVHRRLAFAPTECVHFPLNEAGPPRFRAN